MSGLGFLLWLGSAFYGSGCGAEGLRSKILTLFVKKQTKMINVLIDDSRTCAWAIELKNFGTTVCQALKSGRVGLDDSAVERAHGRNIYGLGF